MTWARDEAKELWGGVDEVEHLWDEEQEQGLAEVTQDAHHSKSHASEIAESITHEHRGWVPVSFNISTVIIPHQLELILTTTTYHHTATITTIKSPSQNDHDHIPIVVEERSSYGDKR